MPIRDLISVNLFLTNFDAIFPGQRHGYGDMGDYWHWLRAEYFVKHLIGDTYWDPDIAQLNLEKEKKK